MLYIYLAMLETPEDKQKMTELYMTYREYLLRVAYNILYDQDDAEDVLHKAFLRVAQNMPKMDEVSCPQTRNFLVTIVRGLAINLYKKRKKVVELSFEELDEIKDDFEMEDRTVEEIGYEALHEAIEHLPDIHRVVLNLMYFRSFSTKEISKYLNLTEAAVKKRLERARHALQKILIEEGLYAL